MKVKLRELAHSRSGDKGNTSNISVIAYEEHYYPYIKEQLTEEVVYRHFEPIITGKVKRYEIDAIQALNFVLEGALGGGVSRNLCLDNYGKTMASAILLLEVEVPRKE
jgi:hypothetical protein